MLITDFMYLHMQHKYRHWHIQYIINKYAFLYNTNTELLNVNKSSAIRFMSQLVRETVKESDIM